MGTIAMGEVRVCWREDQYGKAYLISMGHGGGAPAQWAAEQIDKDDFTDRVEGEDFSWIQDLIDRHLVQSPHAPVSWAAARGRYCKRYLDGGYVEDAFIICIVADIHPSLEDENFYIATLPIGPWEERERAVEQGLRSMAMQRFAREQLVSLAAQSDKHHEANPIPMPLPGLRLRAPIPEDWGNGETPPSSPHDDWDLCSALGGVDWPAPPFTPGPVTP